jgi:hypothetical protein
LATERACETIETNDTEKKSYEEKENQDQDEHTRRTTTTLLLQEGDSPERACEREEAESSVV